MPRDNPTVVGLEVHSGQHTGRIGASQPQCPVGGMVPSTSPTCMCWSTDLPQSGPGTRGRVRPPSPACPSFPPLPLPFALGSTRRAPPPQSLSTLEGIRIRPFRGRVPLPLTLTRLCPTSPNPNQPGKFSGSPSQCYFFHFCLPAPGGHGGRAAAPGPSLPSEGPEPPGPPQPTCRPRGCPLDVDLQRWAPKASKKKHGPGPRSSLPQPQGRLLSTPPICASGEMSRHVTSPLFKWGPNFPGRGWARKAFQSPCPG
ncbi:basic salivary proline-rich protein 2-like [Penaeus monodon]|uniref:basic salivary proline-rich protein 2-like n=1 Tax=Penaeus monodon TaxID=6687 RepID=UPI0018A78F98|nr:basic salivary proline-rich protein 2-like [Penaeus monodon]